MITAGAMGDAICGLRGSLPPGGFRLTMMHSWSLLKRFHGDVGKALGCFPFTVMPIDRVSLPNPQKSLLGSAGTLAFPPKLECQRLTGLKWCQHPDIVAHCVCKNGYAILS